MQYVRLMIFLMICTN